MANMTFGVNLIPGANNTYTLGNSEKKWNVYVNTINGTSVDELGSRPTALSLIAAAGSWSSATPPTQTLTATGVTTNNNIIVGIANTATSAQYDAAAEGKILCTSQDTNQITLTCYGIEPTENIPIVVMIMG